MYYQVSKANVMYAYSLVLVLQNQTISLSLLISLSVLGYLLLYTLRKLKKTDQAVNVGFLRKKRGKNYKRHILTCSSCAF